jgi:hypothetical protein
MKLYTPSAVERAVKVQEVRRSRGFYGCTGRSIRDSTEAAFINVTVALFIREE